MNDETHNMASADFQSAKQRLDEAVKSGDAATLRAVLQHPSLILRREAAEALVQMGGTDNVPHLIEALEKNQGRRSDGSESELMQAELNTALISALGKITGLEFAAPPDVSQVVQQSRGWLQKNPE
jgi:HEAT repeat protein